MSILINENSKIVIQGITGKEGRFHTKLMLEYGTNIVAGVTPGKRGQHVENVPVFDTVLQAKEEFDIDAAGIFVPGWLAKAAVFEAIDAGIKTIVIVTEGVPIHDSAQIKSAAKDNGVTVIGPNTPGVVSAGKSKLGIMDTSHIKPGNVGVISRSGTLTTEITAYLLNDGFGQTTVVGIGGDGVVGSSFLDIYKLFESDAETEAIALVGEIGGTMEETVAEYIKEKQHKPTVAFIAGQNVPEGKRLGHAGAIIEGGRGTAESKRKALNEAGVKVGEAPWDLGAFLKDML